MIFILFKVGKFILKMFGFSKSEKSSSVSSTSSGPSSAGYIILNIIRIFNIISLLTAVAGSWIMIIRTAQTSNFFFFDAVSHFITASIGLFLIISELPIPFFSRYFSKNWPLLSSTSGFITLSLSMLVLGFNILGNLNKSATSIANLGLPLWRVVIAGGILCSVLGLANFIASYAFRDSTHDLSARQVRSRTNPLDLRPSTAKSTGSSSSTHSRSVSRSNSHSNSHSGYRSNYSRPNPSHLRSTSNTILPSYHASATGPSSAGEGGNGNRRSKFNFIKFPIKPSEISRPVPTDPEQFEQWNSRSSPIVPGVERPPTALHPMYSPSRYSVASGERF